MTEQAISQRNRRQGVRRSPRGWTKATCRKGALDLGGDIALRLLDISETGARLLVGQQITFNQEVTITLNAPNRSRPIRMVGKVMWCVETAKHEYCIGVQFSKRIGFQEVMQLA